MTQKAHAKLNIFLKITGVRGAYHEIVSRFVRVEHLYDTLSFTPSIEQTFTIEGMSLAVNDNIITKAYNALLQTPHATKVAQFFKAHKVVIEKNIPAQAGLGGGSSDAATFLLMTNEACALGMGVEALARLAATIGADVPFFVYGYDSANVLGIGEVVTPFEESLPALELLVPPSIGCDTAKVYQTYRAHFFNPMDAKQATHFEAMTTQEALHTLTIEQANDLYAPARMLYPALADYEKEGYFFSGSGSTFFRQANHG